MTNQKAPELLPCPFCGAQPILSDLDCIECDHCGLSMIADDVLRSWNARADIAERLCLLSPAKPLPVNRRTRRDHKKYNELVSTRCWYPGHYLVRG